MRGWAVLRPLATIACMRHRQGPIRRPVAFQATHLPAKGRARGRGEAGWLGAGFCRLSGPRGEAAVAEVGERASSVPSPLSLSALPFLLERHSFQGPWHRRRDGGAGAASTRIATASSWCALLPLEDRGVADGGGGKGGRGRGGAPGTLRIQSVPYRWRGCGGCRHSCRPC